MKLKVSLALVNVKCYNQCFHGPLVDTNLLQA